MNHMEVHVPERMRLEKRPSRDEREDDLPELRTEDGHVMALVERIELN